MQFLGSFPYQLGEVLYFSVHWVCIWRYATLGAATFLIVIQYIQSHPIKQPTTLHWCLHYALLRDTGSWYFQILLESTFRYNRSVCRCILRDTGCILCYLYRWFLSSASFITFCYALLPEEKKRLVQTSATMDFSRSFSSHCFRHIAELVIPVAVVTLFAVTGLAALIRVGPESIVAPCTFVA